MANVWIMENHPIPQDITGFQFKLIGSMTVRQFTYLAIGAIFAFVFFFLFPISIIIRLPVAIISLSIGALFAFVPVSGRPMDTMVSNFFKALFAPTQYIYTKEGGNLSQVPADTKPASPAGRVMAGKQSSNPIPSSSLLSLDEEPEVKTASEPVLPDTQLLLAQTQLEKEALQKELDALKATMNQASQPVQVQAPPPPIPAQPVQPPQPPQPPAPAFMPIPDAQVIQTPVPKQPEAPKNTAIPMPDAPNLITGILKDPRGNPLQNILVEVKDQDQNPVRAFKTNGLGQFASATSLSNGKYIISFEDPKEQNRFDPVQIEAVGVPIIPLEITSVDSREELRRQLFN